MMETGIKTVEEYLAEIEEMDRTTKPLESFRTPLRCPTCGSTEIHNSDADNLLRCAQDHIVCRLDEKQALRDEQTLENIGDAVDRVFRLEH